MNQYKKKYLDLEIVLWDELIPQGRWDDRSRSDVELKQWRHSLTQKAEERRINDPAQELRVLQRPEGGLSVPRTEASLTLKLAESSQRTRDLRTTWMICTTAWPQICQ